MEFMKEGCKQDCSEGGEGYEGEFLFLGQGCFFNFLCIFFEVFFPVKDTDDLHWEVVQQVESGVSVEVIFEGEVDIAEGAANTYQVAGDFSFTGEDCVADSTDCGGECDFVVVYQKGDCCYGQDCEGEGDLFEFSPA